MATQDNLKPDTARPEITMRRATRDDIDLIIAFVEPFVEAGTLLRRTVEEIDEWLPNFFIAEAEGKIVGCAALEVYSKKLAEVRSLAVSPTVQGMGVGKMLVSACVELAREKNILEVMAISSNEQFFLSAGFDFTLPGQKKAFFIQTRDEY